MPQPHSPGVIAVRLIVFAGLTLYGASANAADTASEGTQTQPVQLPDVVVTGSRLPLVAEQSAQDVHIYDRARIEVSGQATVTDFLATLPEVSLNSVESTNGATTVRLRGAPRGSVLVLINGHRAQAVTGLASPFGFFDLNTIPLSMVERIEVLPTGSSAIYGGDALAGVHPRDHRVTRRASENRFRAILANST